MIRRDHAGLIRGLSAEDLFGLLAHHDQSVAELAAEVLRDLPDLAVLGVDRLLALVEEPNPDTLEVVCDLLAARLAPERVTLRQAAALAASRPLPAARLGFGWLRGKVPADEADCRAILRAGRGGGRAAAAGDGGVARAASWAPRRTSGPSGCWSSSTAGTPTCGRKVGGGWKATSAARDDVETWRKLLESPYDDVRLNLVAALEQRESAG